MPDGLGLLLSAATPRPVEPTPSAAPGFDPGDVTPGTEGFIVTFAMVIVVIFLLRDFSRRVRRINLRGAEAERRAAEQAAAAGGGSPRGEERSGGEPAGGTPGKIRGGPARPAGSGSPGTGRRSPPSLKKPPGEAPTAPS